MSTVPVNDNSPINQYTASGGQTVFPFTYWVEESVDLDIYVNGTLKTLTTHYTVSGTQNDSGGNVTFVSGLSASDAVTIARTTKIDRATGFSESGAGSFRGESINLELSRIIAMLQEKERDISRSVRLSPFATTSTSAIVMPSVSNGKALMWSGGVLSNSVSDFDNIVTDATAQAAAAAASASAAATSASNASTSAGNASTSATLAQDWATKTSGLVAATDYSAKEFAQGTQASTGGSAKNWAQQTGADVTGAAANSRSAKSWAQDVNTGATLGGSSKDWAQTTGGTVNGTEYSAKEYATGTSVSTGSAKDWATKTSAQVASTDYSAKEFAQGTQASTGGSAKNWAQQSGADVTGAAANSRSAKSWAQDNNTGATLGGSAKDWAQYTSGTVNGTTWSAKEFAQGSQASTGGSAKNWAQQTGADVTGASANDRSAKSWAQENIAGATLGGSAKDWAQSASLPDGTNKSAKSYAADAQAYAAAVNLRTINNQSGNYTVIASDQNKLVNYTGTGGHTISFTAAATLGANFEFHIKNSGSGAAITIDPNGAETVDGSATIPLSPGQAVVVVCTGTAFLVTQARGYGAGAGSVTSVATGTGLTGGPITGTGTINLDLNAAATDTPVLGDALVFLDASESNAANKALVSTILELNATSRGAIAGLTMTNTAGDTANDIDIAPGVARDSTNVRNLVLSSVLTKRSDAAWAVGSGNGGMDTGSKPNSGTLHVWLIMRSDTGVVDALFSTSATSPTMPTNYDYKRRIGSLRTGASTAPIFNFVQTGDDFYYKDPTGIGLDVNVTNPPTSAVLRTLTIPAGVKMKAYIVASTNNDTNNDVCYLSDPDCTDIAPSGTASPLGWVSAQSRTNDNPQSVDAIWTNTSNQIRSRHSAGGASNDFRIQTLGWMDYRGRFD